MQTSVEVNLKRAHIQILNNAKTRGIGSTVLLGDSEVLDSDCPTAYTDGRNKFYGREFCADLNIKQMVYLALHENLHVFLMHMIRHGDLLQQDAQLANVAMDYVVNGTIETLGIADMIERPPGALVDPKFYGWSVIEVYKFLKTGQNKQGQQEGSPKPGNGKSGNGSDGQGGKPEHVEIGGKKYSVKEMDEHDFNAAQSMTDAERKQLEKEIKQAIQQAGLLAGAQGQELPRVVRELLVPDVDWEQETRDFLNTSMRGDEDLDFRRYDRRYVADDLYMPTTFSERIGTLLICMDTSGSTMGKPFDTFCGGLQSIIETIRPERIRVLHWDTDVRSDQTLTDADYDSRTVRDFLRPKGGGGTCVSNVSRYIATKGVEADCCIVFTDGHLESGIQWQSRMPTLWLISDNEQFTPPQGRRVMVRK